MTGRKVWKGSEVEGRLFGVPTLFWGDRPDDPDRYLDDPAYPHHYFNPGYLEWYGYDDALRAAANGRIVTCGVPLASLAAAPIEVFQKCHIQVIIEVQAFDRLKPTDTIRLDAAAYRVRCAPVHAFLRTDPEAYAGDEKVE